MLVYGDAVECIRFVTEAWDPAGKLGCCVCLNHCKKALYLLCTESL